MKSFYRTMNIVISTLLLIVITGCTQQYDADSWKTIIPADCQFFNDGCNDCKRMDGGNIACTKKMCETYTQPICLDEGLNSDETQVQTNNTPVTDTNNTTTNTPVIKPLHKTWDIDNDGINDCENDSTCDDTIDYTLPNPAVVGPVEERYIGKTIDESQAIATQNNDTVIVATIDGESQYEFSEPQPGRINLIVTEGIVSNVVIE